MQNPTLYSEDLKLGPGIGIFNKYPELADHTLEKMT